jgi:hypothetical protein
MDKNIDEGWKDAAGNEKAAAEKGTASNGLKGLQADFNTLISSMAMEALIFMGELPNPLTKKKEANLDQAKYVIDMLAVMKDKTKGNLTAEEANGIDNILYELRTKFVSKAK